MVRHIVLFRLHDTISAEQKNVALQLLGELGNQKGVREWNIAESLDTRKGIVIVENGLLEDREALQRLHDSVEHQNVATLMRQISDWWVGDYKE